MKHKPSYIEIAELQEKTAQAKPIRIYTNVPQTIFAVTEKGEI